MCFCIRASWTASVGTGHSEEFSIQCVNSEESGLQPALLLPLSFQGCALSPVLAHAVPLVGFAVARLLPSSSAPQLPWRCLQQRSFARICFQPSIVLSTGGSHWFCEPLFSHLPLRPRGAGLPCSVSKLPQHIWPTQLFVVLLGSWDLHGTQRLFRRAYSVYGL